MSELRDIFELWHIAVEAAEEAKEKENRAKEAFAEVLLGKESEEIVNYLATELPCLYANSLRFKSSSDVDRELKYLSKLVGRLVEEMKMHG